jgi:uncharacterized protein (DUF1810 family)
MNTHSIERFVVPQDFLYATALAEIKAGKKSSHWMWFIFPQLRGLGRSAMSHIYGISGVDEARAYLSHPILSARLTEISEALLQLNTQNPEEILGEIDARKLQSSMTLFALISENGSVFHRVLARFYNGQMDERTLRLLTPS